MKNLKKHLIAVALFSVTIFAVSCEEEQAAAVSSNCGDELVALADVLVSKSNTFSANPTASNCSAVRTAALNLLNAANACDEYGYLYEEQASFWRDLDCSEFN